MTSFRGVPLQCTVDTASIWKGGVLRFWLISYQIWSQGPFQLRHLNFFGPLGVQRGPQGGHKGVNRGHFGPLQKLLISSMFFSCKLQ